MMWKLSKINHIFISHLHGDHYYGLIGLLSTMQLFGRKHTLLIGPPGLSDIITIQLKHSNSIQLSIEFNEWKEGVQELLVDLPKLTVKSIPMRHSIPCAGFLFEREKPNLRRINKDYFTKTLTPLEIRQLKSGSDVIYENGMIKYSIQKITLPPKQHYSYAFCSDTKYDKGSVVKWIKRSHLTLS